MSEKTEAKSEKPKKKASTAKSKKMDQKKKVYTWLGVVAGGVVVINGVLFTFYSQSSVVAVPSKDLPAGEILDADDLKEIRVMGTGNGAVNSKESLIGLTLKSDALQSQYLYPNSFIESGFKVPDNKIVVSFQLPKKNSLGDALSNGDMIDVSTVSVIPADASGDVNNSPATYIATNIEVLSVSSIENDNLITISATYDENRKIQQAVNNSKMSVSINTTSNTDAESRIEEMKRDSSNLVDYNMSDKDKADSDKSKEEAEAEKKAEEAEAAAAKKAEEEKKAAEEAAKKKAEEDKKDN